MSGPTTALLTEDPLAILMSAAGIRAAQAIQEGYQQSAELAQQHQSDQDRQNTAKQIATKEGEQAIQQHLQQAEAQFNHLLKLSQRIGADERILANRPKHEDAVQYLRALQSYNAEIQSILLTSTALQSEEEVWEEDFSSVSDAKPITDLERLLARVAHLGEVPPSVQEIADQLLQTLPAEREELLKNELRRQIQLALEQHQEHQVQEANALILRQSLKDLGYQVDEFSDTLFVEGGMVHFRRHGWGDYMVRLRVNEKNRSVNFNVIRAVDAANNERSVLDHLAEDRWCAEFPALLKAMEARGLGLQVTRRLEAGEVPVQLVERSQLPAFPEIEETRVDQPLLAKNITP